MSEHGYEYEQVSRLTAEVERLREEVSRMKAAAVRADDAEPAAPARTNRRQMLRLAGGAAVGAAAGLVATGRAAATDRLSMFTTDVTSTAENMQTTSTVASGTRFLFRDDSTSVTPTNGLPGQAVLAGAAGSDIAGVMGLAATGAGGRFASASGVGVDATGATSLRLTATGTDPLNSHHVRFSTLGSDPYSRGGVENTLDMCNDGLWLMVETSPATWRKLAGVATAGSLHPIPTARIYDSRANMSPMLSGQLNTGTSRLIAVRDKRDPTTAAVVDENVVPNHATAVAYNLTVVNTVGVGGFLSVEPGDAIAMGGSAINWNGNGLAIANASVVKLDSLRQIKVFCGGPATSTNFIIDVVGYYL